MDRTDVFLSTCDAVLFRLASETDVLEAEAPSRLLLFRDEDVSMESASGVWWYLPLFALPDRNLRRVTQKITKTIISITTIMPTTCS